MKHPSHMHHHHHLHHHSHHRSPVCLLNRIWRRKFLLIALILVFLIVTITLTNSRLNAFSSLFHHSNNKFHPIKHHSLKLNDYSDSGDSDLPALAIVPPAAASHYETINHNNNNNDNDNSKRILRFQELDGSSGQKHGILPMNLIHPSDNNQNGYVPKHRIVHLDLKGAPPKVSYLAQIFPWFKRAGATGLLLEYEDTFPFEGLLKHAVKDNAYTKQDIQDIKRLAKENDLEIIPLVQTLGHLEFVLKLQHYRHLREIDDFPQAICPSKNESLKLLLEMIDQVLDAHPESKWLHIGCDEVYQIAHCDLCRNKEREDIFLSHVKTLASYLKSKYNVIAIIWDDMLRSFAYDIVKSYDLDKLGVEIMIWTYVDDIYRFIPGSNWMFYSESFPKIWGASAFKGAFGETLTVPNIKMHLDNNIAWLRVMQEQQQHFKSIQGIVITGWQRYDHLATLCELLPSGFPSLMLNLLTVSNGRYEPGKTLQRFHTLLNCQRNYNNYNRYALPGGSETKLFIQHPNFFHLINLNCEFPGMDVFRLMQEFDTVNKRVDQYLYDVTIHKAWLTDYNFRHNISSPWRINEGLQDYGNVMYSVRSLVKNAISALSQVYDDSTVYEWIEQKIYPQIVRMERFFNETNNIKKLKVWPKRPIKPVADLFRFIKNDNINENDK